MKKIKTLFENNDVLVLDKPYGLSVFGTDYKLEEVGKNDSIDKYLLDLQKKSKKKIKPKYFIVHRLDKDTTGCLLVAKNESSYQNLKKQFTDKGVRKEYIAILWGSLKHDTGLINLPIGRSRSDFRKKEVVRNSLLNSLVRGEERDALTRYKVVRRMDKYGEKFSCVKFYPETGRTHQIRVHAKSLGHPIVADHLYGPGGDKFQGIERKIFKAAKNIRQLLHAESVTFSDPVTGELVKVQSKIPKEFVF